jgi:hypothetical protein
LVGCHRTPLAWRLARALAISSAGALVAVLGYSAMAQSFASNPNHVKVEGGTVSHDSGSADPLTEAEMMNIADSIRTAGAGDEAFVDLRYAGARTFVVYRTGPTSPAYKSRYLAAVPSGVQATFGRALLSNDQVAAIDKIVDDKTDWLRSNGVRLQSQGAGTPGPYTLGYTEPDAPDNSLLAPFLIFGPGTVAFKHEPVVYAF